jgi:D-3-phosphoglycerate dehydrogenase / 2-oxoglutarate reductase
MKIAITTSSFGQYSDTPLSLLDRAGIFYQINPLGRRLSASEVLKQASCCEGIIAGVEPLDRTVLSQLPRLKVISRCGVGIDNIDLEAAEELNIYVRNTPSGPTQAAAELTVCLILDALRLVSWHDRTVRSGNFTKRMGRLLAGKTIGIIGFGRIGQKVARILNLSFDCRILFSDKLITSHSWAEQVSLDEILQQADIISIHASGSTRILARKEFSRILNKKLVLVNAARGGLICESALEEFLQKNPDAHACLDVFENEPYKGSLAKMENITLTAHIGSYAMEARTQMELEAVSNLIQGFKEAGLI